VKDQKDELKFRYVSANRNTQVGCRQVIFWFWGTAGEALRRDEKKVGKSEKGKHIANRKKTHSSRGGGPSVLGKR